MVRWGHEMVGLRVHWPQLPIGFRSDHHALDAHAREGERAMRAERLEGRALAHLCTTIEYE